MGLAWSGCGAKLGEGLWLVDSKLVWGKQSVTKGY